MQNDKVYIDDREPVNVRQTVQNYFETKGIPTQVTRMKTGDFFFNGILIERKDCFDFISSWKTQRIENQRLNMLRYCKQFTGRQKIHPYVVIMGNYYTADHYMQKSPINFTMKQWLGAVMSLEEMGIGVIQIDWRRANKLLAYTLERLAERKEENKTRIYHNVFVEPKGQNWDMKAYQCFPRVGYSMAKKLSETITIRDLLRRPRENAIKELTSVDGVGQKIANSIMDELEKGELKPLKDVL